MNKRIFLILMGIVFLVSTAFFWQEERENIKHKGVHQFKGNVTFQNPATFEDDVTFDNPIIEGTSKTGVWDGAPNVGSIDPVKAFYIMDDFLAHNSSTTADEAAWLDTLNSGTAAIQDDAFAGEAWLTTAATTNAVVNRQRNGEAFQLTNSKELWFETRFNVGDADEADWFVGLAITDTTIMAGVTDRIGFECPDYTGDIDFVIEKNNVQYSLDTGVNIADGVMVRLGFYTDSASSNISAYVNDTEFAVVGTGSIPNDEVLTPTFEVKSSGQGAAACAEKIELDYIKVVQER